MLCSLVGKLPVEYVFNEKTLEEIESKAAPRVKHLFRNMTSHRDLPPRQMRVKSEISSVTG